MKRFTYLSAAILLSGTAFSQSTDTAPVFGVSDVHIVPLTSALQYRKGPNMRGGRYEMKNASMLDLVSTAYGFDQDKVLGGPSWLEMNKYDVVAQAPPKSTTESLKPALQELLAARFKLVVHKDSKPLPTYALVTGKKPLLKEATGKEDTGCKPQSGNPGPSGGMIMTMDPNGNEVRFALGPGMTIQYQCRNVTMKQFAEGLRGMFGADVGRNNVLDETGLEGRWNFDVSWSLGLIGPAMADSERITTADAMEKQLGLKLEQKMVPTPVLVVDSVNEKPTDNPPDIADRLRIPPLPTEFDVAALKPTDPDNRMGRFDVKPGGRVTIQGMPLRRLILNAWNIRNDMLVGAPSWIDSDRYDIIAKASASEDIDYDDVAPLLRKLLTERFQMTTHMEDRPGTAYTLVSVKPKMKKADPSERAHIQEGVPQDAKDPRPPGSPNGRLLTCTNITMAEFASQLQQRAGGYLQTPVIDNTGLEGGFDFQLIFAGAGMARGGGIGGGRKGGGGDAAAPVDAAEPNGAISLFDAIEKQLGLKLEPQKRTISVLVIDHMERKPIDN